MRRHRKCLNVCVTHTYNVSHADNQTHVTAALASALPYGASLKMN